MKVTPEQLEGLRAAIAPLDTPETRERYSLGLFPRSDRTKDLSMRYRWDLLWASGGYSDLADSDLNDSHIDTALRRIVDPLERKF